MINHKIGMQIQSCGRVVADPEVSLLRSEQKQPQSEMEPMFHPENMKIRRRLAPSNLKELAESLGQILRLPFTAFRVAPDDNR